jgi:membrane protease YdiL (CAAX protease family)
MILGLATAALLPILYLTIPNPVVVHWHATNRDAAMPADVVARAARVDKIVPFVQMFLLLVSVLCLTRMWGPAMNEAGWNMNQWVRMLAVGILVGMSWLATYYVVMILLRPTKAQLGRHQYVDGPPVYWITHAVCAAIVEEVWRGYSLTVLQTTSGFGPIGALFASSVAFGLAHARSLLRFGSMALFGTVLALLFIWAETQWATIGAHLALNLGMIGLVRIAYRFARN